MSSPSLALLAFVLLGSVCGALLFIAGYIVGMWQTRHNTTVIERQKVEVVKVPEPVMVEKPTPAPAAARPPQKAERFIMGQPRPSSLDRQEAAALGQLLDEPEFSVPTVPGGMV